MDKDLFGENIEPEAAGAELRNYDIDSFNERLKRLKKFNQNFPFGRRSYGSDESYRIFNEAVHSFIFGQYIATIILAQAFIERRFQEYFHYRFDEKRSKYTMDKFIKEFKGTGFLPDFLLEKIDKIRLKRNPFVHHRMPSQKDTLITRAVNTNLTPNKLLENDAKDALDVMFQMVQYGII